MFSIHIGSAKNSSKRTSRDPNLSMWEVFSNRLSVPATSFCPGGYTAAPGDLRKLRVVVTPMSTGIPTQLKPDQTINSAPKSQVAETLQGLGPEDFVRVQGNVSQNTVATLTDGGDASSLHHHDSQYVRLGESIALGAQATLGLGRYTSAQELSMGLGPSDVGKTWYNSETNEIRYWDGNAIQALGSGGGGGTVLSFAVSTAGTSLEWVVSGSLRTLNIPLASASGVSAGLLSNADYLVFSGKENALTFSGPLSRSVNTISIPAATGVSDGYLTKEDHVAFTAKQAAGDYVTALTGDVTASGPGSATATLANVGTAGTYTKVTTDAKGRVTAGAALSAGDIPDLSWSKITSDKPTTLSGYGITDSVVQNAGGVPSVSAGDESARPAAGVAGRIYIAGDTFKIFRDNGAGWDVIGNAQWATSGNNIYYNSGNVGIGTADPTSKLEIVGGGIKVSGGGIEVGGTAPLAMITDNSALSNELFTNGWSSGDVISFGKTASGRYFSGSHSAGSGGTVGVFGLTSYNSFFGFTYNATDPLNATSSPTGMAVSNGKPILYESGVDLLTLDQNNLKHQSATESATPIRYLFRRTRGTRSSNSVLLNGDGLGEIAFTGDTFSTTRVHAKIATTVDTGTVSFATTPTRLDFFTIPSGGTLSERLTIRSTGNVGIGTTDPNTKLHVVGTAGNTLKIVDGNQGAGKVLTSDADGVASWATPATAPVTSVAGRTGDVTLSNSDISGLGTAATLNVGTGANNVVQLTADPKLPAVDGSLLTNLNASAIASGTVNVSYLPSASSTTAGILSSDDWNAFNAKLDKSGIVTNGNLAMWNASGQLIDGPAASSLLPKSGGTMTGAINLDSYDLTTTGKVTTGSFQVTGGTPGEGKVLTSDASGNAIWTTPALTSRWTANGSNIYYNDGNVGIGTANPTSPLTIIKTTTGNQNFSGSKISVTATPSVNTGASYIASDNSVSSSGSMNFWAQVVGTRADALHEGSGTVAALLGGDFSTYSDVLDTVANSIGIRSRAQMGKGTPTSIKGAEIRADKSGSGTASSMYGADIQALQMGGATNNLYGVYVKAERQTASVTSAYGGYFLAESSGGMSPIASAQGIYSAVRLSSATTISEAKGISTEVLQANGTITDSYGVYVGAVQGTNKWSLYTSDASAPAYFAGNVGIGAQSPDTKLHIAGTAGATLKIVDGNQGAGKVLTSDADGVASWATPATAPVSSVAGRTGDVTLSNTDISGLGTAATLNVGTGANNVVQLTADPKLPAVDGSLLTNLNASSISSGTVNASYLPTAGPSSAGALSSAHWSAFNAKLDKSGIVTNGNLAMWNASGQLIDGPVASSLLPKSGGTMTGAINLDTFDLTTTGKVTTGSFQVTGGTPGEGKVLTSDASGNASWATPALTSQWTTSGSNIYYNAGNVGIGTDSPGQKLKVVGSASFGADNNNVGQESFALGYSVGSTGVNSVATGSSHAVSGGNAFAGNYFNTVTGLNATAFGESNIVASRDQFTVGAYSISMGGDTTTWVASDPLFTVGNGTSSVRSNAMTILKNGRVGLTTTAPATKFDVRGSENKATTAAFEDIIQAASKDSSSPLALRMGIKTDTTATSRYGAIEVDDAGTKRHLVLQPTGGNVGIGVTNPTNPLTIKTTDSNYGISIQNSTGGGWLRATPNALQFAGDTRTLFEVYDDQSSVNQIFMVDKVGTLNADVRVFGQMVVGDGSFGWKEPPARGAIIQGSVGIGTDNPGEKLEVIGNVKAAAFVSTSDRRLKRDIASIEDPLGKILKLDGATYRWKEDGKQDTGLIAQEVEEVFPELVATDTKGMKSVKYGNLVAPLIEAVKALYAKFSADKDEKDRRISSLEEENAKLRQRIERIEKLLSGGQQE